MNKIHILCALAMGFAFAACDEVEENLGKPQTHPQEAPVAVDAITVTPSDATFDLKALNDAGEAVQVAGITATTLPEGYSVRTTLEIARSEDFANAQVLECEMAEAPEGAVLATVAPDALQQAYYENFTHDPRTATLHTRYAVYLAKGNTIVRMGGDDYFYAAASTLTLTPFPASKVIDDSYTLEIASGDDFSSAMAFPFSHSDASVYDDPKFTVTATFTGEDFDAGLKWRIVGASGTVYGPAGDADESGDLLEGVPAGIVMTQSPLLMSIDMSSDTYDYKQAFACMYTPGTSNGWDGAASQQLTTADYVNYTGLVVVINGDGFKVNPDTGWGGRDMGLSSALTQTTLDNGTVVFEGVCNGSDNIKTTIDGLYYVEFNYNTRAIKLTHISTLGIIGDFNGWGASIALTPSADYLTWTSPATDFPAACGWKFRANDDWTINWGGNADALEFNAGGNITTAEAGTYIVTLDVASVPYKAVLAAQ